MRATVILVNPLQTFPPHRDKEVNQGSCLKAIYIIRTNIVIICIFAIIILLGSNHQISIKRFQHVLIRTGRIRVAHHNILTLLGGTYTVRDDTVVGKVATTNHITRSGS